MTKPKSKRPVVSERDALSGQDAKRLFNLLSTPPNKSPYDEAMREDAAKTRAYTVRRLERAGRPVPTHIAKPSKTAEAG